MAGQPIRRQRERAAQRAAKRASGGRATPVDPATREAAVERAAVIGDGAAAAELGVAPATIRSWRRRAKPDSAGVAEPAAPGLGRMPKSVDVDGIDQMRSTVVLARDLAQEAARGSKAPMRRGHGVQVRELAAASKMWAGTVAALEQAIAVAAASDKRLTESQQRLMAEIIKGFFAALALPLTPASRGVLRYLLEHAEDGSVLSGGPDAQRAAHEIREHFAQEFRPQIVADLRSVEETTSSSEPNKPVAEPMSPPPVVEEPEEVVDGRATENGNSRLAFSDLPSEWRDRYGPDQAERAVWEYENALRREKAAQRDGEAGWPRRGRARFDFSHPNLRGGL